MQKKALIRIYDRDLYDLEKQVNEKLSTGKYQLVNITCTSLFEKEHGWYAFMIDNTYK